VVQKQSPEERRQWLEAFKQQLRTTRWRITFPRDYFKSARTTRQSGTFSRRYQAHSGLPLDFVQNGEEVCGGLFDARLNDCDEHVPCRNSPN
jgi:hypothetical protein